jgi:hypothetical protein
LFRGRDKPPIREVWEAYQYGKQTYAQLSVRYGCSVPTIQRWLDKLEARAPNLLLPNKAVVLMDTTYFGRNSGVLVLRDALSGCNLYRRHVRYETNQLYAEAIAWLRANGVEVQAVVCDGRRGLLQLCAPMPTQMCQFHQVAIITRYLTRKPKLPAAQELLAHVHLLTKTDKESFIGGLNLWHERWQAFLEERTREATTGRMRYTHRRLRSAYLSLKRNLPWLFTWYDHPELGIPHTTNAIDGHFADLKNKLRNHNGLTDKRRRRFIDEFLKASGPLDDDRGGTT